MTQVAPFIAENSRWFPKYEPPIPKLPLAMLSGLRQNASRSSRKVGFTVSTCESKSTGSSCHLFCASLKSGALWSAAGCDVACGLDSFCEGGQGQTESCAHAVEAQQNAIKRNDVEVVQRRNRGLIAALPHGI